MYFTREGDQTMKPVEEYFPITLLVILCLFLVFALVTGTGEETESDVYARKTPEIVYTTEYPDIEDEVSSPLREGWPVHEDFKW